MADKWKPFSFSHIHLSIPSDWHLMRYAGNQRAGDFVLDDGEAVVLDASWGGLRKQSFDDLEKRLVKEVKGIEVRNEWQVRDTQKAYRVNLPSGKVVMSLLCDIEADRFILLRLPRPKGDARALIEKLTAPQALYGGKQAQPWDFLATRFQLDKEFLLSRANLNVGQYRMDFLRRGRMLTLWDMALLDQISGKIEPIAYVKEMLDREFKKQFFFFQDDPDGITSAFDFVLPGRRRRRWMLSPWKLIFGNRRIQLSLVSNPSRNRFSIILFQYRRSEELAWLDGLAESLAGRSESPC